MTDEGKALLIVGALLFGAGNGTGIVGSRMSVSAPPAEVRFVHIPVPAMPVVPTEDVAPIEPAPAPPTAVAPAAPEPAVTPPLEAKPLPAPRPKVEVKPVQPKPEKAAVKKPRAPALKKSLPSCAVVQQKYNAMSWAQRMAEYHSASPEEIAYGKRCLGF